MRIITLIFLTINLCACSTTTKTSLSVKPYQVDSGFITRPEPNTVSLTFDDGPSPYYTMKILRILSRYHIHATFFVTARYARLHPKLLKKILDQGSSLANHTFDHGNLTTLNEQQLRYEILESNQLIYRLTGIYPHCFRPPYLAINNQVRRYVLSHRFHIIMGVSSDDYIQTGPAALTERVLNRTRAGSIIIMHDGYLGRSQTVAALPSIIEGIAKKGLGFSTLCKQVSDSDQPINMQSP